MTIRLGDLLVARGVLTEQQRDAVVDAQRDSARPFGALAEQMFGISEQQVEDAWSLQYASAAPRIDPTTMTPHPQALSLIDRRQAWQFRILPIRVGPGHAGEIEVCTTAQNLARVLRFVGWRIERPCYLVVSEPEPLARAIAQHYPMAGATPDMLLTDFAAILSDPAA